MRVSLAITCLARSSWVPGHFVEGLATIKTYTYFVLCILSIIFCAGCIMAPVPLPWKSDDPRFSKQEYNPIKLGISDREEVESILGKPDVTLRDNQLWFYRWSQDHGKMFMVSVYPLVFPVPGTTPLYDTKHALIIEFDDKGIVHSIDLDSGGNSCREDGICLRENAIVTDTTTHNEDALRYTPGNNTCGIYLYTDDWLVRFAFANLDNKALDYETYILCKLSPGIMSLQVTARNTSSRDRQYKFECLGGENVYVKLQGAPYGIMSLENTNTGRSAVSKRRLQILDCKEPD